MLNGLMQEDPLNLVSILKHAARWHGDQVISSRRVEDDTIYHQTYRDTLARTAKLANALTNLGIRPGDRIATLAWNTPRHLEVWYAAAGTGSVCHTINPRLFPEQIEYIVNDAADRILFVDLDLYSVISPLLPALKTLEAVVVLTTKEHMPAGELSGVKLFCYETLIDIEPTSYEWYRLSHDGEASSLCYTSGTTGDPKGVLYSHRGNVLHAMGTIGKDFMNVGSMDSVLMIVPMFHANSWGLVFSLPMVGARMVLPANKLDGVSIHEIMESCEVTLSAAVPTVCTMLLDHMREKQLTFSTLKEMLVGGAALPKSMVSAFRDLGVEAVQGWGMTEMSPIGTVSRPLGWDSRDLDHEDELDQRCSQGRVPYGVDLMIVDDDGNTLANDGEAVGRLMVKGPWIIERYYGQDTTVLDNGWFDTGDIARIDAHGFMTITDRAKDVIKSGGEWISSVDIENGAMAEGSVELAACIGVPHPKWDERPLLLVKLVSGMVFDAARIRDVLGRSLAKWQLPDRILEVDDIPLTATGKIDKKQLKLAYGDAYKAQS